MAETIKVLAQILPDKLIMSVYKNGINNKYPEAEPISLATVFEIISSSDRLKQLTEQYRSTKNPELKKALPYITSAGVFTSREAKGLVMCSDLHIVDIDDIPSGLFFHPITGEEVDVVELIKFNIMSDPNIVALGAMRSPSGNGVKVFVWQPFLGSMPAVEGYQEMHKALDVYIEQNHTAKYGAKVDKKCFDISRASFLCHDPKLLVRNK